MLDVLPFKFYLDSTVTTIIDKISCSFSTFILNTKIEHLNSEAKKKDKER